MMHDIIKPSKLIGRISDYARCCSLNTGGSCWVSQNFCHSVEVLALKNKKGGGELFTFPQFISYKVVTLIKTQRNKIAKAESLSKTHSRTSGRGCTI